MAASDDGIAERTKRSVEVPTAELFNNSAPRGQTILDLVELRQSRLNSATLRYTGQS
jgi:hypothetical protein